MFFCRSRKFDLVSHIFLSLPVFFVALRKLVAPIVPPEIRSRPSRLIVESVPGERIERRSLGSSSTRAIRELRFRLGLGRGLLPFPNNSHKKLIDIQMGLVNSISGCVYVRPKKSLYGFQITKSRALWHARTAEWGRSRSARTKSTAFSLVKLVAEETSGSFSLQ